MCIRHGRGCSAHSPCYTPLDVADSRCENRDHDLHPQTSTLRGAVAPRFFFGRPTKTLHHMITRRVHCAMTGALFTYSYRYAVCVHAYVPLAHTKVFFLLTPWDTTPWDTAHELFTTVHGYMGTHPNTNFDVCLHATLSHGSHPIHPNSPARRCVPVGNSRLNTQPGLSWTP